MSMDAPVVKYKATSPAKQATERRDQAMKSVLDPTFKYRSSMHTDLRKTFAQVKRRLRKAHAPVQLLLPLEAQQREPQ